MEVQSKSSVMENAKKPPEEPKVIVNAAIELDSTENRGEKNPQVATASPAETRETKDEDTDAAMIGEKSSETGSPTACRRENADATTRSTINFEDSSIRSSNSPSIDETSKTMKNKRESALVDGSDDVSALTPITPKKSPQTTENNDKIDKSPVDERAPREQIGASRRSSLRPSKNAERSSVGESCPASPGVGTPIEDNGRIVEEPEEDEPENGRDEDDDDDDDDDNDDDDDDDEDEDDDDDDDEIVEHEEEPSINVDPPEVGIVGPPTAVRDLVNDEELGTTESSSLPSDTRNNEIATSDNGTADVAEWIERSRLTNRTSDDKISPRDKTGRRRKKSSNDVNSSAGPSRKSQKIVTSIIRRSIKCLNKMHAAAECGSGGATVKKLDSIEKREEESRSSPKVPQSRQNGAALPEETTTAMATNATVIESERIRPTIKRENHSDAENDEQSSSTDRARTRGRSIDEVTPDSRNTTRKSPTNVARVKNERETGRKRRSVDDQSGINCGQSLAKKICFEQRERFIDSLVGTSEKVSAEELATRADELRAEVQALDELARVKEMEWNEILSMRKLKEEAYLRIERRRQVVGYMESNGQTSEILPPASLSLVSEWESSPGAATTIIGENTTTTTTTTTTSKITSKESGQSREKKENDDVRLIEGQKTEKTEETSREISPVSVKRDKTNPTIKSSSNSVQRRTASPKQLGDNLRKQQQQQQQQRYQQQRNQQQNTSDQQSTDNRQIGEGRQGPIVDVRSIIADYRLRHPEAVPRRYENKKDSPARQQREASTTNTRTTGLINVRRGRRMRNSVNIGLGAGGAMVETSSAHHSVDSRPSSTDSCKSTNERANFDTNNTMSFKDVLVQFAKLSQQQGEPVKTPQNYPDVTLHPVAPTTVTINSTPTQQQQPQQQQQQQQQQNTGSLLHGILTKSQSPRPTTFSPTLARLLTAPERERTNLTTSITALPQQNIQTQHLLQAYQGSNPVSISDLLSSSKARTEITITPVVTSVTPAHASQSNSLVHVDDVDEDGSMIDDRDSRLGSGSRDNREERDSPPRCQGCQEHAAQFVCAGCGNQWYCSRDCQVAAWDDHSEVCSG